MIQILISLNFYRFNLSIQSIGIVQLLYLNSIIHLVCYIEVINMISIYLCNLIHMFLFWKEYTNDIIEVQI